MSIKGIIYNVIPVETKAFNKGMQVVEYSPVSHEVDSLFYGLYYFKELQHITFTMASIFVLSSGSVIVCFIFLFCCKNASTIFS